MSITFSQRLASVSEKLAPVADLISKPINYIAQSGVVVKTASFGAVAFVNNYIVSSFALWSAKKAVKWTPDFAVSFVANRKVTAIKVAHEKDVDAVKEKNAKIEEENKGKESSAMKESIDLPVDLDEDSTLLTKAKSTTKCQISKYTQTSLYVSIAGAVNFAFLRSIGVSNLVSAPIALLTTGALLYKDQIAEKLKKVLPSS